MVNTPRQQPSLTRKTAQNIMDGTNEELKKALTTEYRRDFRGGENEDDYLVNENDRINSDYLDPNYTDEYMESKYDTMDEVEDEIDRELLAEAKKSLKPNSIHQGEIMYFDKYGNAIVAIYGGDIQGIIYRGENQGFQIGDKIKTIYRRTNKNKNRFVFDIYRKPNKKAA